MRSTKNKMLLLLQFIAVCGIPAAVKGGHVEVISRGFPGKPMTSINRTWLERETKGNFDCVVLLLGTNDACNSKVLSDEKTFEKALNFTVDTILAKKCKLVLLTIPPCNESCLFRRHKKEKFGSLSPNQRIRKFNYIITETAHRKNIILVDFYAVAAKYGTEGNNSLLHIPDNTGVDDGIHLTARGYCLLAQNIAEALRNAGCTNGRILCLGDSLTYGIGTSHASETYPAQLKKFLESSKK